VIQLNSSVFWRERVTVHFNKYTINENEQIGRGACGVIVGCTTPRGSRVVAKIGDSFGEEANLLDRINKLNIPHVVKILDSGFLESREVIVLERAYSSRQLNQSLNVEQLLEKDGIKALGVPQIVNCMKQLFEFLTEMKKHELLHRDIKCANIIIELASGQIRVVDFGWARVNEEHSNAHRQGTFHCLPPEVLLKQTSLKYAGDMWAAGVVLFKMYTGGRLPFGDGNEVLKTILKTLGIPKEEYLETCGFGRLDLASRGGMRRDWRGMIRIAAEQRRDSKNQVDQIIDLLEQIFRYDDERITPEEALKHPLFESDATRNLLKKAEFAEEKE